MKVYVRTAGYKTRDRIWETREAIQKLPAAEEPVGWVSVEDKLPANETEVLAVCVRNGYCFVCPVIYEDGTVLTQDSMWNWYEVDNYGTYSEENDDYFIPAGWWEARQFTPDDVYNNPVDCAVTHWNVARLEMGELIQSSCLQMHCGLVLMNISDAAVR